MTPLPNSLPRFRLSIAAKFFLMLAVVAPLIVAVAVVGDRGLHGMKDETDLIINDNVHVNQVLDSLGAKLARADQVSRLMVSATPARRELLAAELDENIIPGVDRSIALLRRLHAKDAAYERRPAEQFAIGWRQFLELRRTGVLAARRSRTAAANARIVAQLSAVLAPLTKLTETLGQVEVAHATEAHARALRTYNTSRRLSALIALGGLLVGAGSVALLIRNVLPRMKAYSRFATAVAAGDLTARLRPQGTDELAQLGVALNEMVVHGAAAAAQHEAQAEFVDALQMTESEQEAHQLLKRRLERAIPSSDVVVLNRNNSADRLEPTTDVTAGSPFAESLVEAKPRSCLAVRYARPHRESGERDPLIECQVCGKTARRTTCEPLLVSGEVIGSVLIEHSAKLDDEEAGAIKDSVSQAAPVLANLRNLAMAEMRAATDALTGLPNHRAVRDTVKRVVAQASRTVAPLTAVMLDLDHFKQINDTYGHDRGDDVLAAVGSTLESAVRESDFVGRYGGEEFILLLPATAAEQGLLVAEKVRAAVAKIRIPGVDRRITASFGVAAIPEHAGDGDGLVRAADRALYAAKTAGRNRTEVANGGADALVDEDGPEAGTNSHREREIQAP